MDYILKGDGAKCICDVKFLHSAQIKTEAIPPYLRNYFKYCVANLSDYCWQVPVIEL